MRRLGALPRRHLKDFFQCGAALALLATFTSAARSQAPPAPRVFVQCEVCESDYLSERLGFVTLVRDRAAADVHVLVTSLGTASGGRAYTIELTGLARGRPAADTLTVAARPDATWAELREQVVRGIALGLVPYLRGTTGIDRIDLTARPLGRDAVPVATTDRWDGWVFRVSGSGALDGDDNYSNRGGSLALRATRITRGLKVTVAADGEYAHGRYRLSDGGTVSSHKRTWTTRTLVARSVGEHLALGLTAASSSSIFENMSLQTRVMPAVEYDLFPYAEATQRQIVARYAIGARSMRYVDTTIYGRLRESRPSHELTIASDIKQRWGDLWGSAVWSQYLHDRSKHRLAVQGGLDWRVAAGLTFNVGGSYARIRDQLNLPGVDLSDEERLLRLRELQSGSSFVLGLGLSYTFGSVLSNVVNPRFRL